MSSFLFLLIALRLLSNYFDGSAVILHVNSSGKRCHHPLFNEPSPSCSYLKAASSSLALIWIICDWELPVNYLPSFPPPDSCENSDGGEICSYWRGGLVIITTLWYYFKFGTFRWRNEIAMDNTGVIMSWCSGRLALHGRPFRARCQRAKRGNTSRLFAPVPSPSRCEWLSDTAASVAGVTAVTAVTTSVNGLQRS